MCDVRGVVAIRFLAVGGKEQSEIKDLTVALTMYDSQGDLCTN